MAELGEPISRTVVPARHGKGVLVREGEYLKVLDVQGQQVCDFFAFSPGDSTEFLSVCETRGALGRLSPEVGKPLYNNLGQPILLLVEDPVGIHDMRAAACDAFRYWFYAAPQHRACKMNVMEALQEFGMSPPVFPDPLNIFQNSPFDEHGKFNVLAPKTRPGDYVLLRALRDVLAVGSACPMEINPCNGHNPTDIAFEVYREFPVA